MNKNVVRLVAVATFVATAFAASASSAALFWGTGVSGVKPVGSYAGVDLSLPSECMQVALANYDTTLISAGTTYHRSLESAAQTRHDAIVSSWGIADATARKAAQQTAQNNYNSGVRNAKSVYGAAQTGAMTTLVAAARACGEQVPNLVQKPVF